MATMVWLPVDNTTWGAIEPMLRQRDVLTSGYEAAGFDPYDPATYIREHLNFQTTFQFRYDRNVLSRLAEVAQGKPLTNEHRVACAVQVLAQITESLVEPNISLYELGSGCSNTVAQEQLALFRRIDNTHPQTWADLAAGTVERMTRGNLTEYATRSHRDQNFTARLHRWRVSYIACLKIATLELSRMSAEDKMLELIRWMEEDLCFLIPAVLLANQYFAPNGDS